MFTYNATLLKVVDGDTLDLRVDLGFSVFTDQRFRLLGINAPELHSTDAAEKKRGQAAADYLGGLLLAGPLVVETKKDEREKYGRLLARITNPAGVVVNDEMIRAGHAKKYDGGKRE